MNKQIKTEKHLEQISRPKNEHKQKNTDTQKTNKT